MKHTFNKREIEIIYYCLITTKILEQSDLRNYDDDIIQKNCIENIENINILLKKIEDIERKK